MHGPGKGSTYCSNVEDKDRGRFDAGEGEDGEEEGCGWEKKMFFGPLLITSFPCQMAMLVLYHRLLPMAQGSVQDKLLRVKQSPSQHAAPAPLPQGSVRLEVEKGPERDEAFIKTGPRNAVQPPAQKCCLKGWGGYASLPAALMLCWGGGFLLWGLSSHGPLQTPSSCVLAFIPSFISWPWALPQPGTSRAGAGAAAAFACQCWGAA